MTKISASEWKVMRVLWNESPLSANDVYRRLGATAPASTSTSTSASARGDNLDGSRNEGAEENDWSIKTVRTFLSRLVRKGALRVVERENIQHFEPAVDRENILQIESRSFLERFFDGTLSSMFAHFLSKEHVPREELDSLRALLEKNRGQHDEYHSEYHSGYHDGHDDQQNDGQSRTARN